LAHAHKVGPPSVCGEDSADLLACRCGLDEVGQSKSVHPRVSSGRFARCKLAPPQSQRAKLRVFSAEDQRG